MQSWANKVGMRNKEHVPIVGSGGYAKFRMKMMKIAKREKMLTYLVILTIKDIIVLNHIVMCLI